MLSRSLIAALEQILQARRFAVFLRLNELLVDSCARESLCACRAAGHRSGGGLPAHRVGCRRLSLRCTLRAGVLSVRLPCERAKQSACDDQSLLHVHLLQTLGVALATPHCGSSAGPARNSRRTIRRNTGRRRLPASLSNSAQRTKEVRYRSASCSKERCALRLYCSATVQRAVLASTM